MIGQGQQGKKIAQQAALTGIIAAIATKMVFGEVDNVNYYNFQMSAHWAAALGCAVGSVVSDLTSEMVIKRFAINNQIINSSTLAVSAGTCGAASAAVLYFGGLPAQSVPKGFLLGACAKLGGDYSNDKLFSPINGIVGPIW